MTATGVNTRQPLPHSPPPLPNTYWVEPGRLLAGEYPGSPSRADTLERLHRLLAAGVTYFVDLTEPGEAHAVRPAARPRSRRQGRRNVLYARKPIRDHSTCRLVPEIDDRDPRRISIGRSRPDTASTCTAVRASAAPVPCSAATWCIAGMTPDAALKHLNELWRANERSRIWPSTPETDEQVDYVRNWRSPGTKCSRGR